MLPQQPFPQQPFAQRPQFPPQQQQMYIQSHIVGSPMPQYFVPQQQFAPQPPQNVMPTNILAQKLSTQGWFFILCFKQNGY